MNATHQNLSRGFSAVCCAAILACLPWLAGCPGTVEVEVEEPVVGSSGLTGKYVGAQACVTCHSRHHSNWLATQHAGALVTLEGIGQGENGACLGCHTVGFNQAGGFVNRATTDALAGVQCENCHGPAKDHASDVTNPAKRPIVSMSAQICTGCHTGSHHPTAGEWSGSGHAAVDEYVAGYFSDGRMVNSCGTCHSGDFRRAKMEADKRGEEVPDTLLAGMPHEEMNAVSCAVCHNPHQRTNKAASPADGRDYQLRFAEVVQTSPSNLIADVTNPDRFNLCGQCHHSRGRAWDSTSRGPHHSVQGNIYAGEMPLPDGGELLVENRRSIHTFVPKQCATCHMREKEYESDDAPAITGHAFAVDTAGCLASGCHPTEQGVLNDLEVLQTEVATRLDAIASRLGDPATWEYTSGGGPPEGSPGQDDIPDEIKQIRFMYHYILSDGSLGVHNPWYVDSMLDKAEILLNEEGL